MWRDSDTPGSWVSWNWGEATTLCWTVPTAPGGHRVPTRAQHDHACGRSLEPGIWLLVRGDVASIPAPEVGLPCRVKVCKGVGAPKQMLAWPDDPSGLNPSQGAS